MVSSLGMLLDRLAIEYSYECSIFHSPRADYARRFYFSISSYFKRRQIRRFTISAPSYKAYKHGLVTLALPCSLFWMDLTVCMDIQRNPGPDNIFLRSEDQNCDYNGKHANFAITKIIYSKQELHNLRSKYLPSAIYHRLKEECLLKNRRKRGGLSLKEAGKGF